ncbi:MAG: DCC1-like thiol-disulfide oxidoreductase family protein [Thermoleophilaceae bacterium]
MGSFSRSSLVAATPEEVWARIVTPEGVNHELGPLLRMTWPAEVESLEPSDVELGTRLFRSWVLLLGVIPVDYDDLVLVELEPGRRFLERSSMLTQRVWEHERTLEQVGESATRVTDRLGWEPRLGLPAGLFAPTFRAVFAWRHRRLGEHFGMPETALLYDDDCGLCRSTLGVILALDRGRRLRPVPIDSEEARALTPEMTDEQRADSFHLVSADGAVRSAGAALAELIPPLKPVPRVSEIGYRAVADNRGVLGRLIPGALRQRADRRIAARSR